jgi:hypothetical protein
MIQSAPRPVVERHHCHRWADEVRHWTNHQVGRKEEQQRNQKRSDLGDDRGCCTMDTTMAGLVCSRNPGSKRRSGSGQQGCHGVNGIRKESESNGGYRQKSCRAVAASLLRRIRSTAYCTKFMLQFKKSIVLDVKSIVNCRQKGQRRRRLIRGYNRMNPRVPPLLQHPRGRPWKWHRLAQCPPPYTCECTLCQSAVLKDDTA